MYGYEQFHGDTPILVLQCFRFFPSMWEAFFFFFASLFILVMCSSLPVHVLPLPCFQMMGDDGKNQSQPFMTQSA